MLSRGPQCFSRRGWFIAPLGDLGAAVELCSLQPSPP